MGQYWNHIWAPEKPYTPVYEDTEFIKKNKILGHYHDVGLDFIEDIKNKFEPEPGAVSIEFDLCSTDIGKHDTEYVIEFTVSYKIPIDEQTKTERMLKNELLRVAHEAKMRLYTLQLADYNENQEFERELEKEKRLKLYKELKKEFDKN